MYEYSCKKCEKKYEHFLKLHHPCSCGGELRYLYNPCKGIEKLEDRVTFNSHIPLSKKFVPIRSFGGYGKILYYRRKNKLTALKDELKKKL